MKNDETIEPGDPDIEFINKSSKNKPKFSNIEIAIFVGLLVGCAFIGLYLISLGISTMIETPKIIANGTISEDKFFFIDEYYKSDKRNELTISNNLQLNEKWVWIGSPIEYQSWSDMKLLDSKIHEFKSDGKFMIGDIKYKVIMRYYSTYENVLQDTLIGYKHQIMIVTNDKKDTGKRLFKIYEADIKGNVTTPIFILKETDLQPTFTQGVYATAS